jgi:hypothetical protein
MPSRYISSPHLSFQHPTQDLATEQGITGVSSPSYRNR